MYFIIIIMMIWYSTSLYVKDAKLYNDDNGIHRVHGLNWYGMETEIRVIEGLWEHDMRFYFDLMKQKHFNTIRIPFALEGILSFKYTQPISDNYVSAHCHDGCNTYDIMDQLFQLGHEYSIDIVMDLHRLHFHSTNQLWYDSVYTQDDMLYGWSILLTRYQEYTSFKYIDLYNEPHGVSTVNTDNHRTNWDEFVIRSIPYFLFSGKLVWINGIKWGQDMRNFSRLQDLPEEVKNRMIMSPHSYGPTLTWLPNNTYPYLQKHLDSYFGYLSKDFPIVVGEWGGTDNDHVWMEMFTDYLIEHSYDSCFWALNPNSKDVRGYLLPDWTSIDPFKEQLLDRIYYSSIK